MARILLAEDDDQMRAFLARGLRRAGHAVDAVGDGEAAVVRSLNAEYDLLLSDVVMPGIDGIELARRMAAEHAGRIHLVLADVVMPGLDGIELARRATVRWPKLRVMFITGFAAVAVQDDRFAPHRPRILAKPFHLRHLIAEIDALLSRAPSR